MHGSAVGTSRRFVTPRSLVASETLAGALFAASLRDWPLVICGTLKIAYDLLLLAQFRHLKPPEER